MTSSESALSGLEVAALMEELSDAGLEPAASGEPQPFALGQTAIRPTAQLAGLSRMNERLAKRLRTVIEPFARTRVEAEALPIETMRYEDWSADQPYFLSLSLYRLRPLKGGMLIAIEPGFISSLVDAFYGGTGRSMPNRAQELTPAEDRLLGRLSEALTGMLVEAWSGVVSLEASLAARETNIAYVGLVRPEEAVVAQRFRVQLLGGRPTTISIIYPLSMIRPIEEELAAKVHQGSHNEDSGWALRMAGALENVRLPVRCVLARPEMSVSELMALKPGDVIPISLGQRVPLLVASRKLAEGTIGEQEGRAALMIEAVGKDLMK